eukprot:CAMPEP_0119019290 /NCGR_PEP_ID=MMETSP1176-20130426/21439_1 /TAXON_ID=265551 /ORGANISM="Synedropsis recta cf, Strain CCMP1620" /LENGTH=47 /DNA_ID= /DNA_START= /DNA_END= /DNA_ORIENTATION=
MPPRTIETLVVASRWNPCATDVTSPTRAAQQEGSVVDSKPVLAEAPV